MFSTVRIWFGNIRNAIGKMKEDFGLAELFTRTIAMSLKLKILLTQDLNSFKNTNAAITNRAVCPKQ